MNKIKLFCLPFAGGNKYSYRSFLASCPPWIDPITLEYPGRGERIRETFLTDINQLAADVFDQIKKMGTGMVYALYGHSMGGLVAVSALQKMALERNLMLPSHAFVSGCAGPASQKRNKKRHLLEKKEFIREIINLHGSPAEILHDEDLLDFYEPILRADFTACETYEHLCAPPLNIPLTVITGAEEDIELKEIGLWQLETIQPVRFIQMDGDHFFILKKQAQIWQVISKELLKKI
ncbi:thioesterase domain-containing protein [Mucilaginibacter gossypii]|uniref:thioesterase II family protein n=1 Tax=Mucilaginibacter gossypii TaxID=551996 RepID=UPI000DCDD0AF|nr:MULTISPECIES: thioesterase domain-containing protein [Mucilaginibacter]QTE39766.1 thioesterase domain-containing protein [Mucilaginibacter gossypii]RAV54145.1 hypothetical protein DIU36_21180 [Mucilaginibacter rubeus]